MLKVTVLNGGSESRIKVEGKLFAPWVSELASAWEQALQAGSGKKIVVDLSEMTFIDADGKAILLSFIDQGASLVARGICNEHIVEELKSKARAAGAARITG
jgi:anti-anti-sigma regulatory factor